MSRSVRLGRRRARATTAGFTLVELMLVVVIVSILAGLAIPNYQVVITKAKAANILGQIDVVNHAVQSYLGDNNSWPPETGSGQVPAAIVPYLPANFSFVGEDYQLDWENGGGLIGVAVVTDNEPLGNALVDLAGSGRWFASGNRYTFILDQG